MLQIYFHRYFCPEGKLKLKNCDSQCEPIHAYKCAKISYVYIATDTRQ